MSDITADGLAQKAYDSASSAHKRIDKIKKDITALNELTRTVAILTTEIKHLTSSISEVKSDIKSLKEVPADRWNTVIKVIVSAVVSAIAGAFLALILKG